MAADSSSEPVTAGADETTTADGMRHPFSDVEDAVGKDVSSGSNTTDDLDKFRQSAQVFLNIHRAEIAERDAEIVKLKTELTRVREGLKALKERTNAAVGDDVHGDSIARPTSTGGSVCAPQDFSNGHEEAADIIRAGQSPSSTNLNEFLADLSKDKADSAYQTIQRIWESCFQVVKHAMEQDLSDEFLAVWNVDWPDFEERIPNISAVPFESSNSPKAKRTRTMVVMALLAKSLEEYIFSPTYLLEDDDDLRGMLARMSNTEKKTCLRRMLLSISDDDGRKETIKTTRVESAVKETTGPVQTLLPPEMFDQLQSDLEQLITETVIAWEPLQRCQSHYEVDTTMTRARWEWKSVEFGGNGDDIELTTVDSSAFQANEVVMVLFPRVCAIDRTKKPSFPPVFPGVVLQKSQLLQQPSPDVVTTGSAASVEPATTGVVTETNLEAVIPEKNLEEAVVPEKNPEEAVVPETNPGEAAADEAATENTAPALPSITTATEADEHDAVVHQPGDDDTATKGGGESGSEADSESGADTESGSTESEDDTESGTETEGDQDQDQSQTDEEEEDDHVQSKAKAEAEAETETETKKGEDEPDPDPK